ncbi:hypothetical protein RA27_17540 [Ruegeria sp. ANG-R]|nr:hypothetical protein RA27_17540 [Ruegeria sp. ANG-R]
MLYQDEDLRKEHTRTWLNIMSLHSVVFSELNRALSDQCGISLPKFDTMAHLYRFPDGMSMSNLSNALRVSNGNVSGLVNRLIKEGLVQKEMSLEDRRSFRARLTNEGKDKFEDALRVHQEVLADMFADLHPEEMTKIAATIRDLLVKLGARR